ncbi:MAG TPA: tetraacyldisaccharide 4'-kinase [Armatimonadota bacterium]|nr:tetraacyldisaccharide 4'-kinase [Armatimonadota bacterium]
MTTRDYLLAVIDGVPGIKPAALRALLRVGSWLYWLGLRGDMLIGGKTRLPVAVISVGNLSMGGTGKTLAVLKLARELAAAGKKVVILSRGYGRVSREAMAVVSTESGVRLTPEEAGDEPYLLAVSLPGVPVLVGTNRRETGRYALEHFHPEVLLLDDGFQYWRLHRDTDIVLLDALQPAAREALAPRGLFREPWSHLRRAHEVWVTHAGLASPAQLAHVQRRIAVFAPRARVRYTEHRPITLRALDGARAPLALLRGRRVLALSGLGHPAEFEQMLETLGAAVTPCRFPDHHRYSVDDLAGIQAQLTGDMLLVTTPKDAIRLPHDLPLPLLVVEVEMAEVEIGQQPGR